MSDATDSDYSEFIDNPAFHGFLDREFDLAAREASVEELAEFAFGSMEAAVEAFRRRQDVEAEGDDETT